MIIIHLGWYSPEGLSTPETTGTALTGWRRMTSWKGSGNSYDFGARIYDPRIGRWLSLDPLAHEYPFASSYNFALNNPIKLIDPDGRYVRGDKSTSLKTFLKVLVQWEVEASKYRNSNTIMSVGGPINVKESENHAKLRIFDTDFRADKQIVNNVGGKGGFSYNNSFGKYLDVGLPLDVSHFFKMAKLANEYPDAAVRGAYIHEEFKQAKIEGILDVLVPLHLKIYFRMN